MAIEMFEKAYSYSVQDTVVALLHDAGFTDVTYTNVESGYVNFSSSSGVYGVNSFSVYSNSDDLKDGNKYIAVKDDSQEALIVFCAGLTSAGDDIASAAAYRFYMLIIVNGVMCDVSDNNTFSLYCNAVGGRIKSASDTTQAMLTPFIDIRGHVFKPLYISVNRVLYNINTVVTDGSNSFTSLGNLFYIKHA